MKKIYNNNYSLQPQCDWAELIKEDSPTIVQIGAHDGIIGEEYGLQELLETKNCNVILVEPVPEFFNNLKQAYGKYTNCNFIYENSAITPNTGVTKIKKQGCCSYISNDGDIEVNSLSWNDFMNKHKITKIDCLLIDCEGYEQTILTESINFNIMDIPLIRYEYMHIPNKDLVASFLKDKKYFLYYCMYDPTYNIVAVK